MSLTLVATPMGHIDDISIRGKQALQDCEILILEEFKVGSTLIKALGFERKEMFQLNEHSDPEDIKELTELCKNKSCVLISDCGTPNFCDPGALLIKECRKHDIEIKSLPGPASLTLLLSYTSERLNEFHFRGFLPAKTEERLKAIKDLSKYKCPIIIMDTPYRLEKTITQLAEAYPKKKALLGINLTQEDEQVLEAPLQQLTKSVKNKKAEFVLLLY